LVCQAKTSIFYLKCGLSGQHTTIYFKRCGGKVRPQHFKNIHLKKMFGWFVRPKTSIFLFKMWFVRPQHNYLFLKIVGGKKVRPTL